MRPLIVAVENPNEDDRNNKAPPSYGTSLV